MADSSTVMTAVPLSIWLVLGNQVQATGDISSWADDVLKGAPSEYGAIYSQGDFLEDNDAFFTEALRRPEDGLVGYLTSFSDLSDDWDGYGGRAPVDQAISDAISFVTSLAANHIVLPRPMLSGKGIVGLYWDRGEVYVDIEFEGDKKYSYYAELQEGTPLCKEDLSVDEDIPAELIGILSAI